MQLKIQKSKIELIQWLTTIEDADLLDRLQEIKKGEISSGKYNMSEVEINAVNEGMEELHKGDVIPHSEVRKIYEKRLRS